MGRRFDSDGRPVLGKQYKQFQDDNGIPIHLKGGFFDKVLFSSSVVVIGIGVVNGYYTLLSMAFPKKKK